ncbi:MAG: redoxin domain-containing protein [Prevotella sp.]|nr:redoxin domain-containing protein [Prevotella sp.]
MKKLLLSTVMLAFVAMTGQAKEVVWDQPTIEYGTSNGDGFFNLALDVTKVELKDNETVVYITAQQRSDYPDFWFRFAEDTYLKVGEQRFTVTSADGIELGKQEQSHKDGKRDMAFHFPPLPKDTKAFDFIEGDGQGAFQIKGIKPVEERWKQIFPSYWRNDQGDWKIAFFEDCAIYDCKFWDYKQCNVNQKTGEAEIVMTNGNEALKVVIGKDKKGQRQIQIGSEKKVYSMITGRFLPDYPTKDTREGFVDTGYKEDTVTVIGWIKDMPEHYKQLKTFDFGYTDLFTDKQQSVSADLDEQGRFTVKIPIANSTGFYIDWRRCFIRTMFEPGKTYFMLYDFKEGRRFVMGEDCRLQNELFKYPLDWKTIDLYDGVESAGKGGEELFEPYITSVDSLLKAQYANIDALCEQHPTLSTRFNFYRKGNTLAQQARAFGQARFRGKGMQLSDHARRYAYDTFWTKMEKPYTLHRDLGGFLRDYIDDASSARNAVFAYSLRDNYKEFASNDEELALLTRWAKWIDEVSPLVEAEPTIEAKIRKSKELDSLNADLVKEVDKIVNAPKASKIVSGGMLINTLKQHVLTLDSLGANPFIKDVYLGRQALDHLDHERMSLLPYVMDTLRTMIHNPICMAMIEKQNDYYLAIENREFDKLVLKSSDNLADLSEGEALLKKLVEPYKGKFVLLDIWGTWCGPCKEALSHSTEEYARLKDYDIQYLYLANRSPQDSWENVIKEYNVSGPNVAHYNLPGEQQEAIERHLNVHSWPTYKLFNRDGNLLDLNVDPRDLENLARLLDQMK